MPKRLNSATVGALVRQARTAAGITQTQLAQRIGASRFWVAAFEKGKPSAELGLALKAIHALGLTMHIEPRTANAGTVRSPARRTSARESDLAGIIAHTTLARAAPSSVAGWPTASAPPRSNRSGKS